MPNRPTNYLTTTRARRGNYMMTMGAFLPILIGFAALSVDISYVNMSRVQAQYAADAAAHAAFVAYRATGNFGAGNAAADYILTQNLVGNAEGEFIEPVKYGEWNFQNFQFTESNTFVNSAQARVARSSATGNPLNLFFAPLLDPSYNNWDVTGFGTTAGRTRQIIIVHDVSCSFAGQNMVNSRNADIAFLDYMKDNPYPDDMFGVTIYGGRAEYPVFQELDYVETAYSGGGGDWWTKPTGMLNRLQSLNICNQMPQWGRSVRSDIECNTTQARGLIQAREQFRTRGDDREFQAVILISDGMPNSGLNKWGSGNGSGKLHSERAINQLWGKDASGNDRRNWNYTKWGCDDDILLNNCSNADHAFNTSFDGGVHIWTVTFRNGGGDFSWMNTLPRGMGTAYDTPDSSELEDIMLEIAASIPVVLTE